jgi:hypothetical protein
MVKQFLRFKHTLFFFKLILLAFPLISFNGCRNNTPPSGDENRANPAIKINHGSEFEAFVSNYVSILSQKQT